MGSGLVRDEYENPKILEVGEEDEEEVGKEEEEEVGVEEEKEGEEEEKHDGDSYVTSNFFVITTLCGGANTPQFIGAPKYLTLSMLPLFNPIGLEILMPIQVPTAK